MALQLSHMTGVPYSKIYKKLKSKKKFVWIKRLISDGLLTSMKDRLPEGSGFLYEYKRFYPNQEVAGQVLGAVGVDSQGIEGIEYAYDDVLSGKKTSVAMVKDAHGRPITFDETLFMETQEGVSLVLTLDTALQYEVEKELEAQVKKFDAASALGVVQDVKTGEILVMAHYPSYNPNEKMSGGDAWKNKALTDSFEPGSIFKVFLMALALEKGIRPSDRFFCENGLFHLNRKDVIREAHNHRFGWLSVQDILKHSSNIGAAKMGLKLGKMAYFEKIQSFGFGQKTKLGVSGEVTGIVRPVESWSSVDLSNIAFGQGISVTPIQMISAISAIANNGLMMKPMLIKMKLDSKSGGLMEEHSEILKQVVSPEIAKQLTRMMVRTTEKDGTGVLATLKNYPVAGKTGTAQKADPERGGYLTDSYVASFVGFFPANAPRFSIFVMVDRPKKYHYASQVAAPLFRAVAEHTLDFHHIDAKVVKKEDLGFKPLETKKVFKKSESMLLEQELHYMPNLAGRSMREVLEFSSKTGLQIQVTGSGVAVTQSIEEGNLIQSGQTCMVTFRALSQ